MLYCLGRLAWQSGAFARAEELSEEALALFRALGADGQTAEVLWGLGRVAQALGRYEHATALHEEALALRRARGDERGAAESLAQLGHIALNLDDLPRARALLTEALALFGEREAWAPAVAGTLLGHVALAEGDAEGAQACLGEGAALFQALGNHLYLPWCLEGLAGVAAARGQTARAARLCGARDALLVRLGGALPPAHAAGLAQTLAAIRAALGEDACAAALDEGRALPLDEAIALALEGPSELE